MSLAGSPLRFSLLLVSTITIAIELLFAVTRRIASPVAFPSLLSVFGALADHLYVFLGLSFFSLSPLSVSISTSLSLASNVFLLASSSHCVRVTGQHLPVCRTD